MAGKAKSGGKSKRPDNPDKGLEKINYEI